MESRSSLEYMDIVRRPLSVQIFKRQRQCHSHTSGCSQDPDRNLTTICHEQSLLSSISRQEQVLLTSSRALGGQRDGRVQKALDATLSLVHSTERKRSKRASTASRYIYSGTVSSSNTISTSLCGPCNKISPYVLVMSKEYWKLNDSALLCSL